MEITDEMVERIASGIANGIRTHIDDSHAYWHFMAEEEKAKYRKMAKVAIAFHPVLFSNTEAV